MSKIFKFLKLGIVVCLIGTASVFGYQAFQKYFNELEVLKKVVGRLEADSRVAEILVTGVNYKEDEGKTYTTIKFLEYDVEGQPLEPQYFTFAGNIIQFQALVIRFDDIHIRNADELKGRSAYLFWKVFMLDGGNTQEYEVNKIDEIPRGYKIKNEGNPYEIELWKNFWSYALDPAQAASGGIKNAQIEAPGSMFVPGIIYTIKIEHDGGLRIDSSPLSPILRGEQLP